MFMDERMDSLDEIRGLAPDVASMMGDMLRSPRVAPIVKVRIMEMILERTYGKPEASVRLTSAQQNVEAAQARIAAIVSAIRIADDCDGSGVDCRMGRWGQGNPAHPNRASATSVGATPHRGARLLRLRKHPMRFPPLAVIGCFPPVPSGPRHLGPTGPLIRQYRNDMIPLNEQYFLIRRQS